MISAGFRAATLLALTMLPAAARAESAGRLKREAAAEVDARAKLAQEMVDSIYSFAEPGFQERETSAYVTRILEQNGFTIERGVAGIPTAWTASWGKDGPLIALGSDIDALRGLSQRPGSTERTPIVPGAPGHGEGHNAGMPVVVVAALAAKRVMEAHNIPGRLMIWPGVAEELLGSKAYYVRDGLFDGVDACIFTHVATDFTTGWGDLGTNAVVSVEYRFHGKAAHAAAQPWDGRSALDAVELMDVAWNMRREHLPLSQRSHYVITNGGDQPNIVPADASVWYYFRDKDMPSVRNLYSIGNDIADAAAKATGTSVSRALYGAAAPTHGNRPLAEAAYANIRAVGMPAWSADDQRFARAVQSATGAKPQPLADAVAPLSTPETRTVSIGASDDIGDVMWTVPTITVMFPSNIPNLVFHNSAAAMAMATPIAHKGAVAGAKAVAMTVLDAMTKPRLIADARTWFREVQLRDGPYRSLLSPEDRPAIQLNAKLMEEMRPKMVPFYYDRSRYPTYLDQLSVGYGAAGGE